MSSQTAETRTHLLELIQELPEERLGEVRDFVEFLLEKDEDRMLRQASMRMSRRALAEAWENEEDSIYDDLRLR
jgi:hypothetical protein